MSLAKKFSDHMKNIKEQLSILKVEIVALNKSEPKYKAYSNYHRYSGNSSSYTKGVESDHLKIFNINEQKSFAFAFNNENEEKGIKAQVIVSFKDGEKIISAAYSEANAKEKIKNFLTLIKVLKDSSSLNLDTLEKTVVSNFIKGNEFDGEKEVKEALKRAEPLIESLRKTHKESLTLKAELEEEVSSAKKSIAKAVKTEEKKLKLEELKKAFHDALDKVEKLEKSLEKELKLDELENALRKANWTVSSQFESKKKEILERESAHLPKVYKEKVLESGLKEKK